MTIEIRLWLYSPRVNMTSSLPWKLPSGAKHSTGDVALTLFPPACRIVISMQMRAAVDMWLWPRLVAAAIGDVVAVAVVGISSSQDESYLRSEAFLSQVHCASPVDHEELSQ